MIEKKILTINTIFYYMNYEGWILNLIAKIPKLQ